MADAETVLQNLIDLSHELGRPERDLVILGEGNTSALCDDGTFYVKASGTQLSTIQANGFVRVYRERVAALANGPDLSDEQVKQALEDAKFDPAIKFRPSVETVLHALALGEVGIKFVGHTHPVAVNALSCSMAACEAVAGRLFPDEIVVCGPAPLYIPYTDPGLPLARAVRDGLAGYLDRWGQTPKVILMQNHGLIALGANATEVDNITAMYVKTCRVLLGTFAFGGPNFLSPANVRRIHTRPDELYRRQQLKVS
jgi:rhamnose utilization protein RhaD (predicted bifunctional aldolase and dehydrogenase)